MENKTRIILNRKSEWINRARAFQVFVDGHEKARITTGSSEEIIVEPGEHQVVCKIGWCYSPIFSVSLNRDEVAYLKVESNLKYYWPLALLLFAGLFVNLYYKFKNIQPKPVWASYLQLVFMVPVLCYLLYKISFGRKDYLFLGEDTENVFAG